MGPKPYREPLAEEQLQPALHQRNKQGMTPDDSAVQMVEAIQPLG